MSNGYTKLFSEIVDSSIWDEDSDTSKVWITLLALSNQDGFVRGSIGWLAKKSRVSNDACRAAILKFESSDPSSRTENNEGKRVESTSDGWILLNYLLFRDRLSERPVSSSTLVRVRKHRLKHAGLDPDDAECVYCGGLATGPDHIIPKSKGGMDLPENRVPCCPRCNNSKNNRDICDFLNDPRASFIKTDLILKNKKIARFITFNGKEWKYVTGVTGVTGDDSSVTSSHSASASASASASEVASVSEIPSWKEFWEFCQSPQCGIAAEWFAKDKFLAVDDWTKKRDWRKYALRVRGWWENDGRPMTPPKRKGAANELAQKNGNF